MRQTKASHRYLRSCDVCFDLFFVANRSLRYKSRAKKSSTSKGNHNYQKKFASYCWFSLLARNARDTKGWSSGWQTNRRKRNTIAAVCFRKLVESSGHETKEIWIISKQNRKSRERDISQPKGSIHICSMHEFSTAKRRVINLSLEQEKNPIKLDNAQKAENSIFPPREFCNLFFASIVFDFAVFYAASDELDGGKRVLGCIRSKEKKTAVKQKHED